MAFSTYYPTTQHKKKSGGGGQPKGWSDKFQKYFVKEITKKTPLGDIIRWYDIATDTYDELKKEARKAVTEWTFFKAFGPAFKENPLFGVYNLYNNTAKTVFNELFNRVVMGEIWYKRLGYEKHVQPRLIDLEKPEGKMLTVADGGTRYKSVDYNRKVSERSFFKSVFKPFNGAAQQETIWVPRKVLKLFGKLDISPLIGVGRFINAINPFNILSGETFKYFGWEVLDQNGLPGYHKYWNDNPVREVTDIANKVEGDIQTTLKAVTTSDGREWTIYARGINPWDATTVPRVSAGRNPLAWVGDRLSSVSRAAYVLRKAVDLDPGDLGKIGWQRNFRPSGFGKDWQALSLTDRAGNLGRLSRTLSAIHPRNLINGNSFKKAGFSETLYYDAEGKIQNSLTVLERRTGVNAKISRGLYSLSQYFSDARFFDKMGWGETLAGVVPGAGHLPVAGGYGQLNRALYYLHLRNLIRTGETWKRLGWESTWWKNLPENLQGPALQAVRLPYWLHPSSWRDPQYSFANTVARPYLERQDWYNSLTARIQSYRESTVNPIFDTVKKWIIGTRVAKSITKFWANFIKTPTGQKLVQSYAAKTLRGIVTNPVGKLLGRAGLEVLKWGMSWQSQIIGYGWKLGVQGPINIGKGAVKTIKMLSHGLSPRTIANYWRWRISTRLQKIKAPWQEAFKNLNQAFKDIRRAQKPPPWMAPRTPAVQPTPQPAVQVVTPGTGSRSQQFRELLNRIRDGVKNFLVDESGAARVGGEGVQKVFGRLSSFLRDRAGQLANNVFGQAARKALVEGGKRTIEATVRVGGQALTSMLGGGGVTGGATTAATGGATAAGATAGTGAVAGGAATAGGTVVATGGTVAVVGGGVTTAVTSPAWGTALVIGVILFIVIFVLFFLIPGSFRPTDALESSSAKVILSKSVKVEVNDPNGGGTNYLRKDDLQHTVEYTLSVRNLSDKSILRVRVEDSGVTYTKEDIAPGGNVEIARYGEMKTASCTSCPYLDTNRAEGEVFMADGTRVPLSDVGVLIIYDGSAPPTGNPPCGWPSAGMITSIYAGDHDGVDTGAATGATVQEIHSTVAGVVSSVYWDAASGGHIKVKGVGLTGGGVVYETEFIHLSMESVSSSAWTDAGGASHPTLSLGRQVNLGQTIGVSYIGRLTYSTGTHLHYRVRENGGIVDPQRYLSVKKSLNEWVAVGEGCGLCNAGYTNCH